MAHNPQVGNDMAPSGKNYGSSHRVWDLKHNLSQTTKAFRQNLSVKSQLPSFMKVIILHIKSKDGLTGLLLQEQPPALNNCAVAFVTTGDVKALHNGMELEFPHFNKGDVLLNNLKLFIVQPGIPAANILEWSPIPAVYWWDKVTRPSVYYPIIAQQELLEQPIRLNHVIYAEYRTWLIQQVDIAEPFLKAIARQSPQQFLDSMINRQPVKCLIETQRVFLGCTTIIEAPKAIHFELNKYLCYQFPGIKPEFRDMPNFQPDVFCLEAFIPHNSHLNSSLHAIGLCESIDTAVRHFLGRHGYE